MKIKDILAKGQPTLSFEVFPPKEESNFASVEKAALEIAKLNPSFMSVTYGAGGGTSQYTVQIASDIQSTCQVPTLSHLTCVSSTREKVHSVLREIQAHGIENVLALRGDIPKDRIFRCAQMSAGRRFWQWVVIPGSRCTRWTRAVRSQR